MLALLFSFIPFIGLVAWPLSFLGLVFGILGIIRARNGQANNQAMAITGTALAGAGLLVCIAWVIMIGSRMHEAASARQAETSSAGTWQGSRTVEGSAPRVIELDFGSTHIWRGGEAVQVAPPEEHKPRTGHLSDSDSRAVAVDLTITNRTEDEINPRFWKITATHAGRPAGFSPEDPFYINAEIPPGGSLTFTRIFEVAPEPGELRISVTPRSYATDTAYFSGRF